MASDGSGIRFVDVVPFPVSRWDAVRDEQGRLTDFVCSDANPDAVADFERAFPGHRLIGTRFRSMFGSEGDIGFELFERVITRVRPVTIETERPASLGRWLELVVCPHGDGVLIVMRDITERRQALDALASSEERFRSTMEALVDAVLIFRTEANPERPADRPLLLRFDYVNPAAARALGKQPDELVGRIYDDVFPDSSTGGYRHYLRAVTTQQAVSFELRDVATGPTRGSFEINAFPLGDRLVVVVHDVTDRVAAQREARTAERQFRMLADHAGDVVLAVHHGAVQWVAPSVERLMGWSADEVVGRMANDFVHPDDVAVVTDVNWRPDVATRVRCRLRHRDGGWRWVDLVGRMAGPDDEPLHRLVITAIDAQAEVQALHALQLAEDERQRLHEQVQEAVRLESLSQLAGGVAHDFNNLLVAILGNAELALQDLSADSPVRSRLVAMSSAAQRAAELTRQLLDFTGRQPREREGLDLGPLIADTVDLARSMITRGVTISLQLGATPTSVVGDRSQLQQVVMNLLVNAIDAVDPLTGRIEVRSGEHLFDEGVTELGLSQGRYAVVAVSDNGVGIDPALLRRIFDPFFTTRAGGRGLGLAVASGIVRSHGGAIDVRSTTGAGTTFEVLLPAAELHHSVPAVPTSFRLRRPPTVLIVDDDDQVRDVAGDILRRAGFQVLVESRGRDAISTFAARHATIDAVVLDLMMPDITGDEVMVVLRAVAPAVPIVIISGYIDTDPVREAAAMKATVHVRKPFLPEELVDAVRRSLHQTPFGGEPVEHGVG